MSIVMCPWLACTSANPCSVTLESAIDAEADAASGDTRDGVDERLRSLACSEADAGRFTSIKSIELGFGTCATEVRSSSRACSLYEFVGAPCNVTMPLPFAFAALAADAEAAGLSGCDTTAPGSGTTETATSGGRGRMFVTSC